MQVTNSNINTLSHTQPKYEMMGGENSENTTKKVAELAQENSLKWAEREPSIKELYKEHKADKIKNLNKKLEAAKQEIEDLKEQLKKNKLVKDSIEYKDVQSRLKMLGMQVKSLAGLLAGVIVASVFTLLAVGLLPVLGPSSLLFLLGVCLPAPLAGMGFTALTGYLLNWSGIYN
jgi:hypothetical protein